MFLFFPPSVGKNWDFTAALSDFEQLRQVHAGNLAYSFAEDRTYLPPEKEMARVGRPILHRQDEVVQGEAASKRDVFMLHNWIVPFLLFPTHLLLQIKTYL